MADTDSHSKQQRPIIEQNRANPSKYYTHFLNKALIVLIFLVIIPVFPSQAPEFINKTLLNRSWELLHLLFVGIAVSYGLFSRRNNETEKETYNNQSKFDNVQSFVSRFLQVSSVFDDEAENFSGSDESTVQTWSSLYHRNEPPVITAKQKAVLDEKISYSSRNSEKPLRLPVRNLKSRVLNANRLETSRENSANPSSLSRSNSSLSSKRFSNWELEGLDQETLVQLSENNVVLPSPIPWRSRSGRMEVKDDIESKFKRIESQDNVVLPSPTRLSRSNSMSSSPKKLSHPSLSTEAQDKIGEDLHWNFASEPIDLKISRGDACMGKQRDYVGGLSKGKSVKTTRPGDSINGTRKGGEIRNRINGKKVRFDQTSLRTQKLNRVSVSFMPKPTFMEFPQQEKREFVEKSVAETTDEDPESKDVEAGKTSIVSGIERSSINEEASPSSGIDGGIDVDKKADEFIAKVREQIRLQRIDSIKRSSGQMKTNSTR